MSDKFVIRSAGPKDAAAILALVRELAEFEQMLDEVRATAADFAHELARPHPVVHVLLAEQGGQVAGFALYFFNFSTFVGRKGIHTGAIPSVAIAKQDKTRTVIEGNNGSGLKNAIQVFVGQVTEKIFARDGSRPRQGNGR